MNCHFILYVRDQERSQRFYRATLAREPELHVPGMTEFRLSESCVLGLMPESGIKRLLGNAIGDPEQASGIARAEVYLLIDDPEAHLARAMDAGARLLSPLERRDWGDRAAYVADPDGHVLAFAARDPALG